jgi:hypothetical protein
LAALSCLLLTAVTACGTARAGADGPAGPAPGAVDPMPRMRQVADAWKGSAALDAARNGFYPLAGFRTDLPKGAFHNAADKVAHLKGAYVATGPLPAGLPKGEATWPDGTTRRAEAVSAAAAVELLGEGSNTPDGGHTLKVTAARLGETRVATSRGPARIPAWLFTVEGYDAPFTYPAVAWPKLPKSPVAPLPRDDSRNAATTGGPGSVEVSGHSLTVTLSHGSCVGAGGVKALETEDSIVLAVSVLPMKEKLEPGVACDAALRTSRATVELKRPVGDRVLLEAHRGTLMQQPSS